MFFQDFYKGFCKGFVTGIRVLEFGVGALGSRRASVRS